MDDVVVAVGVLVLLLLLLAPVVQILAEGAGNAAPALVDEVIVWAAFHTDAFMLEAAACHAVTGRVGLGAAAQALLVAALVVLAGPVFAVSRTH